MKAYNEGIDDEDQIIFNVGVVPETGGIGVQEYNTIHLLKVLQTLRNGDNSLGINERSIA